jgi:hypothetical protein
MNTNVKLNIQSYSDREKIVVSLANSGYKVWVEVETELATDTYYVCVELNKNLS